MKIATPDGGQQKNREQIVEIKKVLNVTRG